MGDNEANAKLEQRLVRLQKELTDLKARWPAHSVKPELIRQYENLEEEIEMVKDHLLKNENS